MNDLCGDRCQSPAHAPIISFLVYFTVCGAQHEKLFTGGFRREVEANQIEPSPAADNFQVQATDQTQHPTILQAGAEP